MRLTKRKSFGLVLVAALMSLGLVCGLYVGSGALHSASAGPSCLFYAVAGAGGAKLSAVATDSAAPIFVLALISLAIALPASGALSLSPSPLPPYSRPTRRTLAVLQTLRR